MPSYVKLWLCFSRGTITHLRHVICSNLSEIMFLQMDCAIIVKMEVTVWPKPLFQEINIIKNFSCIFSFPKQFVSITILVTLIVKAACFSYRLI